MTDKLPSYRHHRATGQAVVTLNGKDFYLGVHETDNSRAAYDRLIAEWLAHGRQLPQARTSTDITVVELCAAYLQFAETYYSRENEPTSEYVACAMWSKSLGGSTPNGRCSSSGRSRSKESASTGSIVD